MDSEARSRILEAAVALRLKAERSKITVEAVADRADCAKGLVAYHFKTKSALFDAAEAAIAERRLGTWLKALEDTDPQTAIDRCWKLLTEEAKNLTDWSDKNGFLDRVGKACVAMLRRASREPTIAPDELADLCAVTLTGFVSALAGGANARRLEAAYAGFWAAVFALTRAA